MATGEQLETLKTRLTSLDKETSVVDKRLTSAEPDEKKDPVGHSAWRKEIEQAYGKFYESRLKTLGDRDLVKDFVAEVAKSLLVEGFSNSKVQVAAC